MGKDCCAPEIESNAPAWRKALWVALVLNFAMFFVEIVVSRSSGSMSLQADALDFLGDTFNYGISLYVVSKALSSRAKVSYLKGLTMACFGIFVFVETILRAKNGEVPISPTMGLIGTLAFLVNLSVALILYKYRDGDSNMQSVWLCTRNDVIGNLMVVIAAFLVHYTQSGWPDWVGGFVLALLGIQSGIKVLRLSSSELKSV